MNTPTSATIFAIVSTILGDDVEKEFLINFSHHDTKLWLTKTTVWCLTNDRILEIRPASPKDIQTKRMFIPTP